MNLSAHTSFFDSIKSKVKCFVQALVFLKEPFNNKQMSKVFKGNKI